MLHITYLCNIRTTIECHDSQTCTVAQPTDVDPTCPMVVDSMEPESCAVAPPTDLPSCIIAIVVACVIALLVVAITVAIVIAVVVCCRKQSKRR